MGACNSGGKKKQAQFFLKTCSTYQNSKDGVLMEVKTLTTSLFYNLLAKNHNRELDNQNKQYEIVDVRPQAKYQEKRVHNSINLNLKDFFANKLELPKEFKILLNLKTLILVGLPGLDTDASLPEELVYFMKEVERTGIKLNLLYIYKARVEVFLESFELFSHTAYENLEKYYLPLLIFDRVDLGAASSPLARVVRPLETQEGSEKNHASNTETSQRVYIQNHQKFDSYFPNFLAEIMHTEVVYFTTDISAESFNQKYKTNIKKVNQGTNPKPEDKFAVFSQNLIETKELQQSYFSRLLKAGKSFIVVDDTTSSSRILNFIKEMLNSDLKIESDSIRRYIEERIPKFNAAVDSPELVRPRTPKKSKIKESLDNLGISNGSTIQTRCEELRQMFFLLRKETGSLEITKYLYDLILRMNDNILKNPQEEKYRNLNSGNVNLKSSVFKYPSSVKILESVGFLHKDLQTQLYNHSLDITTVKLIRNDLELAYRQFSDIEQSSKK